MAKKKEDNLYALIIAGGAGTRLYPRSTEILPKQFQKIIGNKTLIEQAYDRAQSFSLKRNIFVSTNHKYTELVEECLPTLPKDNYITEPAKRNTGPAIALSTALIFEDDPNAIIVSTHSDHLVVDVEAYTKAILSGFSVVKKNPEYILCVGITPTHPHTGFGYIEKDKKFRKHGGHEISHAKRFVEKPDLETAKEYVSTGMFFWNAGYFVWQAKHFLEELKKLDPSMYKGIKKIASHKNKPDYKKILDEEFAKFNNIAIDNLIMEKTKNLLVLPANIGWSDVGSWDVVSQMVDKNKCDDCGNYTEGRVLHFDTYNTTILSHDDKRIIATVGIKDIIIVTTEEAIIIVPKGRSEEIKKIVEQLEKKVV